MNESLFSAGPHSDAQAPVLIHYLHGAIDAGAACRLAMLQMFDATVVGRVATFNSDELVDYRSSRPVATVRDWTLTKVDTAEIALELASDLEGNPFLILHGPEPDFRWEAFAEQVRVFAQQAGVKKAISLMSVPAAVPHTRPTRVHLTSTDLRDEDDTLPEISLMSVATSTSMFLQERLAHCSEIESVGLVTSVPYYLHETEYFPAASELIQAIGQMGGLSLPVGDLQAAAHQARTEIETGLQENEELSGLVKMLEERFDSIVAAHDESIETPSTSFEDTAIPSADEIGHSLESFLRFEQDRKEKTQKPAEKSRFPRRPRRDPRLSGEGDETPSESS
ncbi:PAC2 family protein [Boudabousia marimammalium]|uniref:PAC2 family protein n=1 Tax=Boudabousia marimammalium TaxID=156892 RepID=A0A1Q5PP18_9ACTO|nr:PAC2 family protein [Boudabousia marimammalium]OKL49252.1 hypothetical protein BM477_04495 [Boudabousia marimammalium]